jgi:hypothetical protein
MEEVVIFHTGGDDNAVDGKDTNADMTASLAR